MIGRRFTSERIRKERREQFFVIALLWFALAVVVVLLCSQLSQLKEFRISKLSFSGNKNVATEAMAALLLQDISGSYWHLFPKQNVFLVRTNDLEKKLIAEFPRLKRVMINRTSFTALSVLVEERDPYAFWCSDTNTCYFLDKNGFIFAPAAQFSKNSTFVRYVGGEADSLHPIGSQFISEDAFAAAQTLIDELKRRLHLRATQVTREDEHFSIAVAPNGSLSTFSILVTATSSYEQALLDFETIIESADFKEAVPSLSSLDYIDLRFGNKVFYTTKDSGE